MTEATTPTMETRAALEKAAEPKETRERRPSSAELVRDVAVAGLARAPQPPEHTVGLTLNAKGDVQIEVAGRGADLAQLAASVSDTFDSLRSKYRPVGTDAGIEAGE